MIDVNEIEADGGMADQGFIRTGPSNVDLFPAKLFRTSGLMNADGFVHDRAPSRKG